MHSWSGRQMLVTPLIGDLLQSLTLNHGEESPFVCGVKIWKYVHGCGFAQVLYAALCYGGFKARFKIHIVYLALCRLWPKRKW